ncbi:hypothetical protein NLU13_4716 [Sarocladium strictum]|uniref:Golgi pH regulator n=1 Tax=Sarocladium strictum TaxID=5046 RepID=A0AA39L8X3_SARSR|nr:hypothetical protein NLU13_4716 [Sarocladium strictum]
MWPFENCFRADSCEAAPPSLLSAVVLASLSPFFLLFTIITILAARHIFPRLSHILTLTDGEDHFLPAHAPPALRQAHAEHGRKSLGRRFAALTFGMTVGGAGTLGALMLVEILGVVTSMTRDAALRVTEPVVLFLVVGLVPWLECRSLVTGAGWSFQKTAKGKRPRVAWTVNLVLFGVWLFAFWSVGRAIPVAATNHAPEGTNMSFVDAILRGSLERVGVVGISLMALLAGFASVSTPWHTFGMRKRKRPVTEADIQRKEGGLEATSEMLATKRHRLGQLERKIAESQAVKRSGTTGGAGVFGKMMGTLRGPSADEAEVKALRMEISGLETMEASLSTSLALLKTNRAAAVRASTPLGRLLIIPSFAFSAYCVYRILATSLTTMRRISSPSASFSASDPINRFLGLLARHWDPDLDQLAWARTISFLLSGVILLASLNSVAQTFHLFSRLVGSGLAVRAAAGRDANLALAVGQVVATYVVSAGLLLRSQLPREVGQRVMGGRVLLSPGFVDGWFEGWFLIGVVATAVGLWVGRKLGGGEDDWDDYGLEEMGEKRS